LAGGVQPQHLRRPSADSAGGRAAATVPSQAGGQPL